jgi:transposase
MRKPEDSRLKEKREEADPPQDLDFCPRCGEKIAEIIWGKTNCPRCGLHFECC